MSRGFDAFGRPVRRASPWAGSDYSYTSQSTGVRATADDQGNVTYTDMSGRPISSGVAQSLAAAADEYQRLRDTLSTAPSRLTQLVARPDSTGVTAAAQADLDAQAAADAAAAQQTFMLEVAAALGVAALAIGAAVYVWSR